MSEKHNAEMREALESIINAKEPKPEGFRQPDDGDWRFYALEMKRVVEAVLRATATSRCDRCGSSGDVFVLCSGCHGPIPSPHPRGEELTPEQIFIINDMTHAWIEERKLAEFRMSFRQDCKRLLATAAPPPAGADAVREALQAIIEANAEFRTGMPNDWSGDPLQDAIDSAASLIGKKSQPQEKPTGDQT